METLSLGRNDINIAAHLFQPERLTLARELKEVTKQELAVRINKTASAISQFESSQSKPDASTLGQIAMALGIQLQFFARKMNSDLLKVDDCHFRSLRSASQKQRKKLLAMGSILGDILQFCEQHINLPTESLTAFSKTELKDSEIEDFAIEMRKHWGLGLGPLPNLIKLLESRGVVVTMVPETCREVNAFSTWVKERPFIFLSDKGSPSLNRFDAAHELLHLLAHADAIPGCKSLERQADKFAGCFLLPRDSFIRECPNKLNWDHFTELKERWGVSYRCLVRRAYDLGCLSEATYKRAFVLLNQHLPRLQEPNEPAIEKPTLLKLSIEMISEDIAFDEIAANFGLSSSDFARIINNEDTSPSLL